MQLRNGFEQGAQDVELAVSGSANPDPWDAVIASAATASYDNTFANGFFSGLFQTAATGDTTANVQWRSASFGTQTEWYARFYCALESAPLSSNTSIGGPRTSSALACRVRLDTDGKLRLTDASGATQATAASAMATGKLVRIEWHIVHSATVGSWEMRVFETDPTAAVADYDYALSASGINTSANAQGVQFGWSLGFASLPKLWIDSVEVNTSGWIGPSSGDAARVPPSFVAYSAPVVGNATTASIAGYATILAEQSSRLQFVAEPRRGPTASMRVEVRQDDHDHDGTTERTEHTNVAVLYAPGDDFWFGMSIFLDPTIPDATSTSWVLLHQFFGETGGTSTGSPPFAIEFGSNGRFTLTVRGGVKATPFVSAPREAFYTLAAATKGEWHDFLFHLVLSTGTDGSVDAYHKLGSDPSWPGSPTVSDTGINVLTVAGVPQFVYPETGMYRHTRPEIGVVYHGLIVTDPNEDTVKSYFNNPSVGLPGSWR